MKFVEVIGDAGYLYTKDSGSSRLFEATALSSTHSLIQNPAYANRFEGVDPVDVELAQHAYHIFHQPFALYADIENGDHEIAIPRTVDDMGLEEFARGFQVLRRLFGESEYGGLQVLPSEDTERMPPEPYLGLIEQGEMVVSEWVSLGEKHDVEIHLIGGMLITREIREVLKAAARRALINKNPDEIGDVTNQVDFTLSDLRNLWRSLGRQPYYLDKLASRIIKLVGTNGLVALSDAQARCLANTQLSQLNQWQRERPFVLPATIKQAGETAVLLGARES